jgi:hypothetical protein
MFAIALFLSLLAAIMALDKHDGFLKVPDVEGGIVNSKRRRHLAAPYPRTRAPAPSPNRPTSVPVRFPIPVGSCNICDTGKPVNLTIQYMLPSKFSVIQSSYASCLKSNYPASTSLIVEKLPAIPVQNGTVFTIKDIVIGNRGVFEIQGWGSCHIDTSCYTPLVVGDQIGPFLILAGNQCARKRRLF